MPQPVLIAPHNDDETLFASFLCLRHKPLVLVALRSEKQARDGITAAQREAETAAAMVILGCEWRQLRNGDLNPDWAMLKDELAEYRSAPIVFTPAYEPNGHRQHNEVTLAVEEVFPRDRIVHYLTYTTEGKSTWGEPVPFEDAWVPLKLRALLCYESQLSHPLQVEHFLRDYHEYVTR